MKNNKLLEKVAKCVDDKVNSGATFRHILFGERNEFVGCVFDRRYKKLERSIMEYYDGLKDPAYCHDGDKCRIVESREMDVEDVDGLGGTKVSIMDAVVLVGRRGNAIGVMRWGDFAIRRNALKSCCKAYRKIPTYVILPRSLRYW